MALSEGFVIDERGKVVVGMFPEFDYSHLDTNGSYTPSYTRRHARFLSAGVTHTQMVAQAEIDGIDLPIGHGDIEDEQSFYARARDIDELHATQIIVQARHSASVHIAQGGTDDG